MNFSSKLEHQKIESHLIAKFASRVSPMPAHTISSLAYLDSVLNELRALSPYLHPPCGPSNLHRPLLHVICEPRYIRIVFKGNTGEKIKPVRFSNVIINLKR